MSESYYSKLCDVYEQRTTFPGTGRKGENRCFRGFDGFKGVNSYSVDSITSFNAKNNDIIFSLAVLLQGVSSYIMQTTFSCANRPLSDITNKYCCLALSLSVVSYSGGQ